MIDVLHLVSYTHTHTHTHTHIHKITQHKISGNIRKMLKEFLKVRNQVP